MKKRYVVGAVIVSALLFVVVWGYLTRGDRIKEVVLDRGGKSELLGSGLCKVLNWDHEIARLEIACGDKNYGINVDGSGIFLVTIDRSSTGKQVEDVVIKGGMNWTNGFCSGDEVKLVLKDEAGVVESTNLKEIRNKGPRYCKWVQI